MTSPILDAKSICNDKILDTLNHPMFMIFQLQHDQISDKVDSDNKLLYHFKQSMSKMKQWSSTIVKDFCEKLVIKFPELKQCEFLMKEMINLTCTVLDEAQKSEGRYVPTSYDFNEVIHSFIVECSLIFIEHPEWFSQGPESTEYQTCINNAKNAMRNGKIVENVVRKYVSLTTIPPSSDESSSDDGSSSDESDKNEEPIPGPGLYLTSNNIYDSESEEDSEKEIDTKRVINVETGDTNDYEDVENPSEKNTSNMIMESLHSSISDEKMPISSLALNSALKEPENLPPVRKTDPDHAKLLLNSIINSSRPEVVKKSGSQESGSEESGSEESGSEESGSEESGSDESKNLSNKDNQSDYSSDSDEEQKEVEVSVCDLDSDLDSELLEFILDSDESGSDESGSESEKSGSGKSGSESETDESESETDESESETDESESETDESESETDESESETGESESETDESESDESGSESESESESDDSGSDESGSDESESGESDESGSESEESGSDESEKEEETSKKSGSENGSKKSNKIGVRPASRRGPSANTLPFVPPQLRGRIFERRDA